MGVCGRKEGIEEEKEEEREGGKLGRGEVLGSDFAVLLCSPVLGFHNFLYIFLFCLTQIKWVSVIFN